MEVNRPGLALMGHLEQFRSERIQVIGRGETSFLKKSKSRQLRGYLSKIVQYKNLPCFVITCGIAAPVLLKQLCEEYGVPLLQTALETADFIGELHSYIEDCLAPSAYAHGVLVGVYGLGVLLRGKSGIGKSECALELLKRGHLFVADDLVKIKRLPGDILVGGPSRGDFGSYMEVRGLGVIDVKSLFGIGHVMDSFRIGLVVTLEMWRGGRAPRNFDRLGLVERTQEILGVKVPHIIFPVFPGRNLAILVEVASLNQELKNKGVYSAVEFEEKVLSKMTK